MTRTDSEKNVAMQKSRKTYQELRYEFLKKYKPELYHCLIQENQLIKHLTLIQQSAENREKQIIDNLIKKEHSERCNTSHELTDLHNKILMEQARQIVEIEIIRV
ncbi:TnpV protein [Acetobacterium sp.]|uniref:TnpV protein n=1 Tax=Acetobacterium sp. TaxID=1872094 RepID=UPI002728C4E0|nr:TnpV protein [Acetobacterium sp.]MDO9492654.1 TnpV protein [Acetobacterium sp.]